MFLVITSCDRAAWKKREATRAEIPDTVLHNQNTNNNQKNKKILPIMQGF